MKLQEINIRDPFILLSGDMYYMYGTRSKTAWGPADGFDAYTSTDLQQWEGPFEIFHNDGSFWATECYWAPECIFYRDRFYLITTFAGPGHRKGIQILQSVSPLGPFVPVTAEPVTPAGWNCIDGSVFIDDSGTPWLLFSHSFPDEPRGAVCAMPLSDDLIRSAGSPVTLFYADEAPWAKPIPFAKEEFNMDGDVFFSDGPYVYRKKNGSLHMIWSSWSRNGYAVGLAAAENGRVTGPWRQRKEPVYGENGGHGMVLQTKEGTRKLVLHYPNDKLKERPVLIDLDGPAAGRMKEKEETET